MGGVEMKSKGFTLVELLVVVILTGILAAIAIPTIEQRIENVRKKEATTILNSIWAAERSYRLEQGNYTADVGKLTTIKIAPSSLKYYDYGISLIPNDFLAAAIKKGTSKWLAINAAGLISEGDSGVPGGEPGEEPGTITPGP